MGLINVQLMVAKYLYTSTGEVNVSLLTTCKRVGLINIQLVAVKCQLTFYTGEITLSP